MSTRSTESDSGSARTESAGRRRRPEYVPHEVFAFDVFTGIRGDKKLIGTVFISAAEARVSRSPAAPQPRPGRDPTQRPCVSALQPPSHARPAGRHIRLRGRSTDRGQPARWQLRRLQEFGVRHLLGQRF